MKLGDGVEAAIHCAASLGGLPENAVVSGADMAVYFGLSQSYLLKHLKVMVAAGILVSIPGPKGGYRLAKSPEEITLLDIVLAVEGPEPAFRCRDIRRAGPGAPDATAYPNPCGIKAAMLRAERAYRAALRETTLRDLMIEHETTSDPRVLAYGCAVIEKVARFQS